MRISDWSSDVCSSDLGKVEAGKRLEHRDAERLRTGRQRPADGADRIEPRHDARRGDGTFRNRDDMVGLRPVEAEQQFLLRLAEIGRASWRERVCQYV